MARNRYSAAPEHGGSDFLMVPVPRDRVIEVYTLLAARPTGNVATDDVLWTEANLTRLIGRLTPTAEQLLGYMASHPDQWVSLHDLARGTGLTQTHVKGAFSGLRRTIKAHVGTEERPFMVTARRVGRTVETAYQMTGPTAEKLVRLLGNRLTSEQRR